MPCIHGRPLAPRRRHVAHAWLTAATLIAAASVAACGPRTADAQASSDSVQMAASRPNIVLIMADDMGFSDLGSYGSPIIQTPNIDGLAATGLRFTQFYNAARCVPTRASLLTGLHPHQAGIGHMVGRSGNGLYNGVFSRNAITLAEGLGAAGYDTYMAGKWHLTPWRPGTDDMVRNGPTARGFERFYGTIMSIRGYFNPPSLMEDGRELPPPEGDYYYTDAISEHAVDYIEQQAPDQPYFLYVAYTAPHFPLQAPEEDIAKYRGRFKAGWDVLKQERYKNLVDLGLIDPSWPLPDRDPQQIAWDDVNPDYLDWFDARMATYAAMIDRMDRGIGTILDAIDARGDRDNTIIIFLSDNGGCAEEINLGQALGGGVYRQTRAGEPVRFGNDPSIYPGPEDAYTSVGLEWASYSNTPFRRFKSFVHEGGIATPLIVSWPSRIDSRIVREPGHIIDIMPTLLDLAGAEYPKEYNGYTIQPMEGRSLLPLFEGGTRPPAVYVWEHEGNRAIRDGDYKLVSRYGTDWELFDMRVDRLEANDLARALPDKVAELNALYETEAERIGIRPWVGPQTAIGWPDDPLKWAK
jgi:arylsulfatase A-like enzyme